MRYLPPLVTLLPPRHSRREPLTILQPKAKPYKIPKGMENLLLVILRRLVTFTLRMRYLPPLVTLLPPRHSRREPLTILQPKAKPYKIPKGMENLLLVILRRLVTFTLRMRYLPPLVTLLPPRHSRREPLTILQPKAKPYKIPKGMENHLISYPTAACNCFLWDAVLSRRWLQHNQTPFPQGISYHPPTNSNTEKQLFLLFLPLQCITYEIRLRLYNDQQRTHNPIHRLYE